MAESLEARVASLASRRDAAQQDEGGAPGRDLADMALALRWGALCLAVISMFAPAGEVTGRDLRREVIGVSILVVYGLARTVQPVRPKGRRPLAVQLCLEAGLCTAVAAVTGGWSSPLLLMVGCALLIAGLLGGFRALGASLATFLVLAGAAAAAGSLALFEGSRSTLALQRILELAAVGVVGAYAHRLLDVEGSSYNRLKWMNELHALLLELYALAAEHPGLFTVKGAVTATVGRVRDTLKPDVVAVLLRQPTAEGSEQPWEVAFAEGVRVRASVADADLPPVLQRCAATSRTELHEHLGDGDGLERASTSGLYAPIFVRGSLAGLLVLERRRAPAFSPESCDLIEEIARHAGLAIDNARSFLRLRSLGAEEERERIARDLHDRVGQSLAAAAFNIDRVVASLPAGAREEVAPELESLSREVRAVNGEIREKLTELRGGPTERVDVIALLEGMLAQVATRSNLCVRFDHALYERPPDLVEREIWRIGCEAIRNAERHSGGHRLSVSLRDEAVTTVLEVVDDGRGIGDRGSLRPDAYGLVGMRERADLIGATLVVGSGSQGGTTVRLRVPRS